MLYIKISLDHDQAFDEFVGMLYTAKSVENNQTVHKFRGCYRKRGSCAHNFAITSSIRLQYC